MRRFRTRGCPVEKSKLGPHGGHTAATRRPRGGHAAATRRPRGGHAAATRRPHGGHTAATAAATRRPHGGHTAAFAAVRGQGCLTVTQTYCHDDSLLPAPSGFSE
ncbi:hypothetical protein NHX12_012259 [Muraenolepis orangiensis]|uniref:Uncharacterized protein n=1 Tax=Muraenolepis orangiensis TaxID=630683 RepID=A0A9Q0I6Y2_9TELE|nr:hypothetical protein NHX12_012259 [Muraenolepis orangiensis]